MTTDLKPQATDVLEHCACQAVRVAARSVTRMYDDALRPTGLRATQMAVLAAVEAMDASSIMALAKTLGMDRSTLARALAPMVESGLIDAGAEAWRRSRSLALSDAGRERLAVAWPIWQRVQATLRDRLGPTGLRDAIDSLRAVTASTTHQSRRL